MARAVTCPVCGGKGTIQDQYTTAMTEKTCHGCGGKGWVEVSDRDCSNCPYTQPHVQPQPMPYPYIWPDTIRYTC